jgi:hypothetical protein
VSFNASGAVSYTGPGELTETWSSGRAWRWTSSLGSYSQVRVGSNGALYDDKRVAQVPMRVQMLRGAVFGPIRVNTSGAMIRSAAVQYNGHPATCILLSRGAAPEASGRSWVETEYCVDDATGLLDVYSEAPGMYAYYDYSRGLEFHGRTLPNHVTIYVAGASVIDAQVSVADAPSADASLFTPTAEMLTNGPVLSMMYGMRFPVIAQGAPGNAISPVIVHATLDSEGKAMEQEVASAADPSLVQPAMELVKSETFASSDSPQRDVYINVRFVPRSQ